MAATLLALRDRARQRRRLDLYHEVRRALRDHLHVLIPGQRVVLFGSLTRPGVFNDASDVDLALEGDPHGMSAGVLMGELMERLGRPVDLVRLDRCRFRDRILREGEVWIC